MRTLSSVILESMRKQYIGRRIRLDYTSDPYTTLRAGDEGVIDFIDDIGTLSVKWDNGSSLGLLPDEGDRFTFL
jgi:hypothetical protein